MYRIRQDDKDEDDDLLVFLNFISVHQNTYLLTIFTAIEQKV